MGVVPGAQGLPRDCLTGVSGSSQWGWSITIGLVHVSDTKDWQCALV